ncbi:MAG: DNA recombination protein RmuC [Alphaproteobacteria bacterium]|nr:DNA recombination protein RmuC [Alphaproteobacteria bacterium]
MTINWTLEEQYIPFITIGFCLLFLILCILYLRQHKKLRVSNTRLTQYTDIELQRQIELSLLKQKIEDISNTLIKTETEREKWQSMAQAIEKEYSIYQATATAKESNLNEKITYLEKIKDDLVLKFKAISTDIINAQHESFSKEQKNTLSAVINPFAEQLKAFKAEVIATREESIKNKSNLDAQLNNLAHMNLTLSKDAQNLAEALKGGKKAQGNWGECQLNRILEISGLRKGQDYETQESFTNEEKKIYRPDVIIHLPENRDIIVDSKVSLTDYLDAVNTEDEDCQQKFLQKNVQAIKSHIDELSAKEYQKLLKERTLNYVIMFIPVESAYIAALEYDRYLYDYAYKKNIILATPLSLLPTLRTIENLWKIDNQNHNVQKIAELGGKIYDKLASFVEDMKTLERGINQANTAYTNAMIKLAGKGGALSHAEKMKILGAKTGKNINLTLNDTDIALIQQTQKENIPLEIENLGEKDA